MTSVRLQKAKLAILLLVLEVVFIVLFALTTDYEDSAKPPLPASLKHPAEEDPHSHGNNHSHQQEGQGHDGHEGGQGHGEGHHGGQGPEMVVMAAAERGPIATYYPMFQDVHVMIFVGFGFLMTFLRRYGFSSVGINMLVAAVMVQWAMLVTNYIHGHGGKVHLGVTSMLTADFATAAVLITMGALLGKTSPLQLVVIGFLEMVLFAVNEWIGLSLLKVVDVGGSMFVHAFGAYFGLAASRVLYKEDVSQSQKEGSVYHSDIFAMVGTVFLWLFWPSFNSALAVEDAQHRAVLNTFLALAACCVVTFAISSLTDPHGKFDMVHVQNASLAGGVAVGTSADMMIGTYGALLIGSLAGALSVIGYRYITPFLASRLKVHDTCGVNNLHGLPAILAALAGAVASALADVDTYGYTLYRQFPARAPANESSPELHVIQQHVEVSAGQGRSAGAQAGYQMAALGITLVIAVVGGLLVGLIARFIPLNQPAGNDLFEDRDNWEVPEEPDHSTVGEVSTPLMTTPSPVKGGDVETGFFGKE
ncbi:ammonium transporter Rh type B-like [Babylonia areolata]|uniref:ammonium transporter Rh type B-like n=1 Tax=Babylonia areolata TaxID=304850 RepID=UPI003FD460BC